MSQRWIIATLLVALGVLTAGCNGEDGDDATIKVVATTTVLGDVAANVVGGAGTVDVLLPIGADPHDYQASAQQVAQLQSADLVVANGLGLEEGLEDVLEAAAADGANVLYVGEFADPLPFSRTGDVDHGEEDHGDDEHGDEDPHVWLDPIRVAGMGRIIASELAAVAPEGDWETRAESYAAELTAADEEIMSILSVVPTEQRKLVANHQSLGYFADRYGFEVIGTVIPGGATLADPSSAELAELVAELERQQVPAIFAETTEPAALADAVAAEAGQQVVVVDLYTGSLGEDGSGAETLINMLLTNARLVAEALS